MKMNVTEAELNERILNEKRLAALEVQTEAWADGISEGIDPEIMAAAGMETILINLVRDCGAEAANGLLALMKSRFESGAFHSQDYLH